jgi:hypothetical protein
MAEYSADVPLWWEGTDDAGLVNLATLDLPAELVLSLRAWNTRYESQLDMANPQDSKPMSPAALTDFDLEGRRLLQALRDHFGERVVVTYFSPIERREIM